MGKLLTILRRAPKRTSAVLTMIAAAIIVPATLLAWGPDRPTFTTQSPAGYVTFNSITNNPAHGDERNFMQVKESTASDSTYSDSMTLQPGKEYTVFVYYHNDAASNLNASGKGIATGAYVRAEIPAVVSGSTKAVAHIGAANAEPKDVWDDVTFKSTNDIALRMVSGSAKIFNEGATNGSTLPDSIITTGTAIGYDALDGTLPGCNEFSGYVTFNVKADQPNFTISKEVSKHGANKWVENYSAQPGEVVDYLIEYKNTGTTLQNDVVIKDKLPAGMTYVKGSTVFGNAIHPAGTPATDDISKNGINVGAYNPGGNVWATFSAKITSVDNLKCGINTLNNIGRIETNNGSKEDNAKVTVNKECQPGDISVCVLPTESTPAKIITINESDFDSKTMSKDLSDCVELPHTGPTENIVAMIGLGALVASIGYFVASRRAGLNQ